jgi:hypothetical protein
VFHNTPFFFLLSNLEDANLEDANLEDEGGQKRISFQLNLPWDEKVIDQFNHLLSNEVSISSEKELLVTPFYQQGSGQELADIEKLFPKSFFQAKQTDFFLMGQTITYTQQPGIIYTDAMGDEQAYVVVMHYSFETNPYSKEIDSFLKNLIHQSLNETYTSEKIESLKRGKGNYWDQAYSALILPADPAKRLKELNRLYPEHKYWFRYQFPKDTMLFEKDLETPIQTIEANTNLVFIDQKELNGRYWYYIVTEYLEKGWITLDQGLIPEREFYGDDIIQGNAEFENKRYSIPDLKLEEYQLIKNYFNGYRIGPELHFNFKNNEYIKVSDSLAGPIHYLSGFSHERFLYSPIGIGKVEAMIFSMQSQITQSKSLGNPIFFLEDSIIISIGTFYSGDLDCNVVEYTNAQMKVRLDTPVTSPSNWDSFYYSLPPNRISEGIYEVQFFKTPETRSDYLSVLVLKEGDSWVIQYPENY